MTSLSKLLVAMLLAGVCLQAQTGTGNIQGTVTDPTGAVVPGAAVTAVQKETAQQHNATSNSTGSYLIPSVPNGNYKLTVEAKGMETWKGDLTLEVGQTAEIKVSLKIGQNTAQVTVAGDVSELTTTTDATLSTVVERARIDQLPVNGRLVYNVLSTTIPGMVMVDSTRGEIQTDGLLYSTEYLQDGAVVENRDWGFVSLRPPGLDTIEEFRVETHNTSAKSSRPANVITSTRSGTNQVHGSLFETMRNNGIGVARARTDYTKAPELIRNEFGASLGGPIYVPKLYNGHNRTFFFVAWEGLLLRSNTSRNVGVPTAAMRQGDFSGVTDSLGRPVTIYDPWSVAAGPSSIKVPYPNNQIPIERESPFAKYLYSVTPLPTLPTANPFRGSNWYGTGSTNQNSATLTAKLDQHFDDRNQLSLRYSHSPYRQEQTAAQGTSPTTLDRNANGSVWNSSTDSGVANFTHTFSPTFFSESSVAISTQQWLLVPISGLVDIDSRLGLPNPFGGQGFPTITGTGLTMDYEGGTNITQNFSKVFNIGENLTKVKGNHTLQFGGLLRLEYLDTLPDETSIAGVIDFSSDATSVYDPGSGAADVALQLSGSPAANLFLGVASSYQANFRRGWYNIYSRQYGGYFQDDFKVSSRLTLNLGLRYEFNTPIQEAHNGFVGFDPQKHAVVVNTTTAALVSQGLAVQSVINAYENLGVTFISRKDAGLPPDFVYKNPFDFFPRVGFAWRALGSRHPLVVRGGFGIYGYPEPLREWNTITAGSLPGASVFSAGWNSAAQSPDGLVNYYLRHAPSIIAGVNSSNVISLSNPQGISIGSSPVDYVDPHQPTVRSYQWNFTLEKQITENTKVRATYAGTHGANLMQLYYYNQAPASYVWYATTGLPLPTGAASGVATRPFDNTVYGTIGDFQSTGWSNDQSLQFEIQRRFSRGIAFQAFYVMSNALEVAKDGWRNNRAAGADILYPVGDYLPGAVPTNDAARDRLLYYARDPAIPKHSLNYNWIVDLPFGTGKKVAGNAGRLPNGIIGGWQSAGSGVLNSNFFALPENNWNFEAPLQVYGTKYPVQDCRTGVCYPGYLYYNGYIPANQINTHNAAGNCTGVCGVPSSYAPAQAPLIPTPANGGSTSDPNYKYYETNDAYVTLKSGTRQLVAYNNNLNPWRNQYLLGPMTFVMNASLFKTVRIAERAMLRFNADFFNVLNQPGTPQPATSGIVPLQNSANTPRQLQLTLRLTW